LKRRSAFEAARAVSLLPEGHRSRRLHGHSFLANVRVALPTAWGNFPGAEVDDLRDRLSAAVAPLDYQHLNSELVQPPTRTWLAGFGID